MPQIWELQPETPRFFARDFDRLSSYYLQNFHHQTNGYFSDLSANLYDLQVEILFGGSADPMRRRSLFTPWAESFDSVPESQIRVLDVACGTGRTPEIARSALPQASFWYRFVTRLLA